MTDVDVNGCGKEKAQRALMFEEMGNAQKIWTLTGRSGRVELDGLNSREILPLFMLQNESTSPASTILFGSRARPAVRP